MTTAEQETALYDQPDPEPTADEASGTIRYVTAVEWVCPTCRDTGYARTLADAAEALGEHREDFH